MKQITINILYIFVALIIVLHFAFSNHNQYFLYSKQFKFIFIILLITLSSYNYTLALISLLLYIAFNEYHIENFSNSSKLRSLFLRSISPICLTIKLKFLFLFVRFCIIFLDSKHM